MSDKDNFDSSNKKEIAEAREEFDVVNYTRDLFFRGNPTRDTQRKIQWIKSSMFIKLITGSDYNE